MILNRHGASWTAVFIAVTTMVSCTPVPVESSMSADAASVDFALLLPRSLGTQDQIFVPWIQHAVFGASFPQRLTAVVASIQGDSARSQFECSHLGKLSLSA